MVDQVFKWCGYPLAYTLLAMIYSPYIFIAYVMLEAVVNPVVVSTVFGAPEGEATHSIECWWPVLFVFLWVGLGVMTLQLIAMQHEWRWSFKPLGKDLQRYLQTMTDCWLLHICTHTRWLAVIILFARIHTMDGCCTHSGSLSML